MDSSAQRYFDLAFAKHIHEAPREIFRHGVLYGLDLLKNTGEFSLEHDEDAEKQKREFHAWMRSFYEEP